MSEDPFLVTARVLTRNTVGATIANAIVLSTILDLLIKKGLVSHDEVKEQVVDRAANVARDANADSEREDDNRNVPKQLMMLIQEVAANLNIDPSGYELEAGKNTAE